MDRTDNENIKERAGESVVIFLEQWKKYVRRRKIYRICLLGALCVSCIALVCALYYKIDSSIPSVIHLRAGREETFDFGIPAKAEVVSVSGRDTSNIPQGAVNIDLSESVTLRAAMEDSYQLQVKLFGFLNFKNIEIQVIEDQQLIPVGSIVGIYVQTNGILVIGTGEFRSVTGEDCAPGKDILKTGDYIREVNGAEVTDKEDFIQLVRDSGGQPIQLTVERQGQLLQKTITPMQDAAGEYKIGVWVRDSAQGVGTMTYIDGEGNFGALGHGITDVDTGTLMQMDEGTLYKADVVEIKKGTAGDPGEMTGMIIYSDDRILGEITDNCSQGIFGTCDEQALKLENRKALPIGLKQEIVKGAAQMLCSIDGVTAYYDIEITGINLDNDNVNRGIEFSVTDAGLIERTGGIVQGMSGSPIIQNGKIIGAVTHVLVNSPTKGYGVFIENMLQH